MATKKKVKKARKQLGGTLPGPVRVGRSYEFRNKLVVIARKLYPEEASFQILGEVFDIDKTTAEDIFKRDKDKYHV